MKLRAYRDKAISLFKVISRDCTTKCRKNAKLAVVKRPRGRRKMCYSLRNNIPVLRGKHYKTITTIFNWVINRIVNGNMEVWLGNCEQNEGSTGNEQNEHTHPTVFVISFLGGAVLFDASKVQLKYREYFVLLPCSCIINKWILMIFFVLTYYYTWYDSIDIFLLAWFDRVREKNTQKQVCWCPLKIGSCQSIIQTQFAFSEARQQKVRGRAILSMLLTI